MKIAECDVHSFRIPFKESITVSGKRLYHREGFLIALVDDRHQTFFGEVAPLPGLDTVSLSQCREQLCRIKGYLKGHFLSPEQFDLKKPFLGLIPVSEDSPLAFMDACVQFGLESALLELTICHGLCGLPDVDQNPEICVNGLFIPVDDNDRIRPQLDGLGLAGFDTVKVKIGRIDPSREIEQIRRLVDFFDGSINLRLDGNRSLSLTDYNHYYHHLGSLPVEYVEEPLPAGKWTEALTIPWPLALDESLGDFLDGPQFDLGKLPWQVRHIIVKPGALPGIHQLFGLLATASENRIQVVLSSAFNTSIGLSALGLISHLACNSHETVHGLDTLKYLGGDLLTEPLVISKGKLRIPTSLYMGEPGLNSRFLGEAISC
ncbi:MAG: o-succinylbenzoate synthase [SAR324 cluster bacterium]|nr:o-succinylbenzoate synthase [SAR324 cluster bacterium]